MILSMREWAWWLLMGSTVSILVSCKSGESPDSLLKRSEQVRKAKMLVEILPSWDSIRPDDSDSIDKLIATLRAIDQFPTEVIREAIVTYIADAEAGNVEDFMHSKLLAMNKFLFLMPDGSHEFVRSFGGWDAGDSDDAEKIGSSWPLRIDEDGTIHLVGKFHGYSGPEYAPLAEFDHFNAKYGRRAPNRR